VPKGSSVSFSRMGKSFSEVANESSHLPFVKTESHVHGLQWLVGLGFSGFIPKIFGIAILWEVKTSTKRRRWQWMVGRQLQSLLPLLRNAISRKKWHLNLRWVRVR
jgi:hypothetical protein